MDGDQRGAAGAGRAGAPLRFRVEGLDCQNEVRALKGAVGPLVGGEDGLAFDTRAGLMSVAAPGSASAEAIARAVAGTGMRAELLLDDVAPASKARPATPGPEPLVFQVRGLDCQNEVRALRQAVGPLVGGDDRLWFDTAKGIMTAAPAHPVSAATVVEAVARTGMSAMARVGAPGSPALLLRVRGLDCKNEVALLERALGPLVGGTHALAFDTERGAVTVIGGPRSGDEHDLLAAIREASMDAEPWEMTAPTTGPATAAFQLFRVEGLDCQNEVAALRREVGPVVGGPERLLFDPAKGLMAVTAAGSATGPEIETAVARTGMRATAWDAGPEGPSPQLFRVAGLDCKNEAAALTQAVGPVVGGAEALAFDTGRGAMIIAPAPGRALSVEAIRDAVARTGMRAEPWSEAAEPAAPDACGLGCGGDVAAALAPPLPTHAPDAVVFKVHGLDCGDEVAALKREVGPVVGTEDRLSFDLLNGRMAITGAVSPELADRIEKAVARTGMRAEPWQEGEQTAAGAAEDRRRRVQTWLTTASGVLAVAGVALHAWLGGGLAAALGAEEGGGGTPLPAILAYAAAIACAVRYVAPKAWLSARRLRPDMNLLMVVAVAGAVGIGEWFEAAIVSFFFALALALEGWSLGRARRAVAALMELAPATARVLLPGGGEREVPAAEVAVGARVLIRPGDKLPLDGRVAAGESEVNQAPITGESVPVHKAPGAEVFAGTINGDGALEVETTKAARDTTLAQIIRMVGSAQGRRAPSEQWVERFARVYTPAVMVLALAVFLVPPLLLGGAWDIWFYRALVLLVIACPCALVISTPVTIVAALAGAAKQGVLVKGGLHLETPAKIRAMAMDKTGTLTEGRPRVVALAPLGGRDEAALLGLAAALEARSEHPLAKAILDRAAEAGVAVAPAKAVQAVPGKGLTGRVGGRSAWLGSRRFLEERGLATPEALHRAEELASAGRTVVAVGDEAGVWGLVAVADTLRPGARQTIAALHAAGIERVVMLTGDNRATAEAIARETGVDEVRAELLPADKVAAVEDLVARYGAVAMVGDGVNDAPAMARANLGIAMGAIGSDAAIETADVALMSDDIAKLPWLVRHSRATLRVIRQNIGFSVAVKLLFTGLTVAGLASLWGAIAADVGASLLVVLNGLRLLGGGETTAAPPSAAPPAPAGTGRPALAAQG
ncbi:heavy metal translocating P-type ATPase [Falsiroseomonas tokyonensis]|uniref:P-type Zn(2+) transporter n=1 Tax=Falsiroseomonas tokyonensis TaxID=430521 RepID=A0ABV7C220_9PROT|nr:heavy metal translocating P-type ATPase [Falsiroseomonas tokyonensis]MBU8541871.1 heavy metal translocating P-type ATPase [Falsiroseomonas tokyonensis]